MRLEVRGTYPPNWRQLSLDLREVHGWRCVRCLHPFGRDGKPLQCDRCDATRCRAKLIADRGGALNYGVHHLDGDKGNCAWWNLLPLCNACHLTIQAKVIPERSYLWAHSDWFLPYVCGFYAHYYGGIEITREVALATPDRWLALGQPWRYEAPVHIGDIVPTVMAGLRARAGGEG